jgi:L-ascorbate 6-phosphate lactonase
MSLSGTIRPVKSGATLLDEIARDEPRPGSISAWWLGQSGYAIKFRSGLLVVDPYLSEHLTTKYADTDKPHVRMTVSPFRGHELARVDVVLASHKHSDHLDPGTTPDLLASSPGARLVLPRSLIGHAESLGIAAARCNGIDAGETIEVAGFRVRAVPSAHEGLDTDADGHHLYLGFVVEVEGLRIYHSGDTLAYDGLVDHLGPGRFDVMFLPINGRDPSRGVAGNMMASEAVDLAARVKPRFVVPHHYDMFTFNTVHVGEFEAEARRLPLGVSSKVLRCGERWEVGPWA